MGNQNQYGQQAYAVASQQIGGIEPPTALHPAHAGLSHYKENAAPAGLQTTAQWLTEARQVWEGINQARMVPDPSLTEDAHILRVNKVAEAGINRIGKGFDRARTALATAEAGYMAEVDAAARLAPTAHASEIRAVVRALPEQERYATLIGAMNTGDSATLAAVLSAPGITSGLTDEQVGNLRTMYRRKVAPDALASLEAVRKAQIKIMAAFDQVLVGSDDLALRQRAGLVKDRQRQAEEAARLAEGPTGPWGI